MKNQPHLHSILAVVLLTIGLSSPQISVWAKDAVAPKPTPKATPTVKETPTLTPAPTALVLPLSEVKPLGSTEEINLLEIFPVQEPWGYKGEQQRALPPDEAMIAAKAEAGEVWVNSKSGVFHKPNTTYYGKTKAGFFLPEAQAIEQGYRGIEGQ